MLNSLTDKQRKLLTCITLDARDAAETAARAALENLAVHEKEFRAHMGVEQRLLRNRLRARGRALGDRRDSTSGSQDIRHLTESVAYEHWHRLLFTRFLAENHLLHTDAENGHVPVTLEECDELAPELGARDGFDLACRFASETLPGIFRLDDPALALRLAPNHEVQLRKLLDSLPAELFRADDALGWTYQFWQARRKEEVNKSGVKIGADELSAVTQLFTEDYMVEFLLHNSLGAWWAGRCAALDGDRLAVAVCPEEADARRAVALPPKGGLPRIDWTYLRFILPEAEEDNGMGDTSAQARWCPAAGTFEGWPKTAAEIRFLDPCMGSGHFLVFVLPILARLRMEEEELDAGQAVAAVIRDNLHGLELDERCTQIAAFNVALTAWKLGGWQVLPPLHLACSGLAPHAAEKDWIALAGDDDRLQRGMERLYRLFKDAPVLGSLINPLKAGDLIDAEFNELQPLLAEALKAEPAQGDEILELGVVAKGLAKTADILAGSFNLVVTNVPYLGRGKQDEILANYCEINYPEAKADLATCFVERCRYFCSSGGCFSIVSPQNWLFLSTYRSMRKRLLKNSNISFIVELGAGAFQTSLYDFSFTLFMAVNSTAREDYSYRSIIGSSSRVIESKIDEISRGSCGYVSIESVISNSDSRILVQTSHENEDLLSKFLVPNTGMQTGDNDLFCHVFWELPILLDGWEFFQRTSSKTQYYGGRELVLLYEKGIGKLRELSASQDRDRRRDMQGANAWGKIGILVHRMGDLPATIFTGEKFDQNGAAMISVKDENLTALWCYISSSYYKVEVRKLDNKVGVTPTTLVKVPFKFAHWQQVAAEKYPNGLPKPHSDDPTQWLFNGHPKGSEQSLHVAVARLLGYRWPRQTGSEFPDCPALGPDGLEDHADPDGIVCLPPLHREQPAAARLRTLLAAALGSDGANAVLDETALLAAAGAKSKTLEDWLRDEFFEQHCKLFHQRPFIWHIWDGRKDGFHALVNYHRLDHATLQKLTYSYLGDWIRQQDADAKADKPGAAERLGAARALETELVNILQGEPPYDLFIRWKPLKEQPLGWNPDLNDGVRLNIRPFLSAKDLGKKGAGILRIKPNIKWDKDRGKEPYRDKADFPWFWHEAEPPKDCQGDPEFTGHRWNDVHFTLAHKNAARDLGD